MVLLAVALLAGSAGIHLSCGAEKPPAPRLLKSIKGFEIYSWKENNDWCFALLIGTNRLKTQEEVMAEGTRLAGVERLKQALEKIERGQAVVWSRAPIPGMQMPPADAVQAIRAHCRELGLKPYF
jgi:hypothetical protein